jgi:hypothetical protein
MEPHYLVHQSCLPDQAAPGPSRTDLDGIDDVTGLACPTPGVACTDADLDGIVAEPVCTDVDGDGFDDVTGLECPAVEEESGKTIFRFGEIRLAFRIADETQVPVEDLFDLRLEGLGWGQIMQEYGPFGGGKGDDDEEVTCTDADGG